MFKVDNLTCLSMRRNEVKSLLFMHKIKVTSILTITAFVKRVLKIPTCPSQKRLFTKSRKVDFMEMTSNLLQSAIGLFGS